MKFCCATVKNLSWNLGMQIWGLALNVTFFRNWNYQPHSILRIVRSLLRTRMSLYECAWASGMRKSDLNLSKFENTRLRVHMFVFQDQSHFTCLLPSPELLLSQAVYHVDGALSTALGWKTNKAKSMGLVEVYSYLTVHVYGGWLAQGKTSSCQCLLIVRLDLLIH